MRPLVLAGAACALASACSEAPAPPLEPGGWDLQVSTSSQGERSRYVNVRANGDVVALRYANNVSDYGVLTSGVMVELTDALNRADVLRRSGSSSHEVDSGSRWLLIRGTAGAAEGWSNEVTERHADDAFDDLFDLLFRWIEGLETYPCPDPISLDPCRQPMRDLVCDGFQWNACDWARTITCGSGELRCDLELGWVDP